MDELQNKIKQLEAAANANAGGGSVGDGSSQAVGSTQGDASGTTDGAADGTGGGTPATDGKTDSKVDVKQLRASQARYRSIIKSCVVGTDDEQIKYCNEKNKEGLPVPPHLAALTEVNALHVESPGKELALVAHIGGDSDERYEGYDLGQKV